MLSFPHNLSPFPHNLPCGLSFQSGFHNCWRSQNTEILPKVDRAGMKLSTFATVSLFLCHDASAAPRPLSSESYMKRLSIPNFLAMNFSARFFNITRQDPAV
jgi:hypothetical protein